MSPYDLLQPERNRQMDRKGRTLRINIWLRVVLRPKFYFGIMLADEFLSNLLSIITALPKNKF